jgi:hypothetical protein
VIWVVRILTTCSNAFAQRTSWLAAEAQGGTGGEKGQAGHAADRQRHPVHPEQAHGVDQDAGGQLTRDQQAMTPNVPR